MRVNVRALGNALELWRESIGDCSRLDLERLLPQLVPGLDTLGKRFERFDTLWQIRQQTDDDPGTDDTGLLNSLELTIDSQSALDLSHFDRAALMSFVQQLEVLDRVSRELLCTLGYWRDWIPVGGSIASSFHGTCLDPHDGSPND